MIVMEALNRMLSKAMFGGYLSGFRVDLQNGAPLEISHLLFADDTLIICNPDQDEIYNLAHIHLCFESISSLKLSLRKSEVVAVGEVP
jgi:hypothetical protein